jgi:type III secretory pathway component EscT
MIHLAPRFATLLIAALARLALASLRLVPLTLALPFLGGRTLPTQSRVPVLVVLAIGTLPTVFSPAAPTPLDATVVLAAGREISLGIVLALVLGAPFFALEYGGRLLDTARGANAAEVIAPDSGARTSPLAELLRWSFGVVFLASGGFRAILRVVASSFAAFPPDAHVTGTIDTARFVERCARFSADALGAGLTLVSAGLFALLAVELVFAIAARSSPPVAQSQLALPVRALAPLAALAVTVSLFTGAAREFAANAIAAADALFR